MPRSPGYRSSDYSKDSRFSEPHSPWQQLIETRRTELEISMRTLGGLAKISANTLFNWLRSPRGCPPIRSYPATVNKRLAEALQLDPQTLQEKYTQSRLEKDKRLWDATPAPHDRKESSKDTHPRPAPRAPVLEESPAGYSVRDPLSRLLAMLRASGRTSFTLDQIELFADTLRGQ